VIQNGYLVPSDAPGFGLEIDQAWINRVSRQLAIETFRLESEELRDPAENVDTTQCNLDRRRLALGLSLRRDG